MALVAPAKRSLWVAVRTLRKIRLQPGQTENYELLKKSIEDAIILLEMTPDMIDPALKLR